jgi:excisionase family DNA binding protein
MKTLEERKAILNAEINHSLKNNWRVTTRTDTTCQLIMERKPETCLIILLLLFFIIPLIIYLLVRKKTTTVYVEVNEDGEVIYTSKDLSTSMLQEANELANKRASSVVIETTSSTTAQPTTDLGLLTTGTIAEGLKISEDDVIKLIKTNELKGKKIGDKYFVRKEDFDAYMKE